MPRRSSIKQYMRARHDSLVSRLSSPTFKEDEPHDISSPSAPLASLPCRPPAPPPISPLSLISLPTEILMQIATHLRPSFPSPEKEARFDGAERRTFVASISALHSLTLTNRLLHSVAQEHFLCTIVLGGFDGLPAIVSLVRYLLDFPAQRRFVKRLRLGLPPNERYFFRAEVEEDAEKRVWEGRAHGAPPSDVWLRAAEVIALCEGLDRRVRDGWLDELARSYARPLCGVLIVLCERLEELSISHSLGGCAPAAGNRILKKMFGVRTGDVEVDFGRLEVLSGLRYFNGRTEGSGKPRLRG